MSYLSSIIPTIKAIKEERKIANTNLSIGRNNIPAIKAPMKSGIPPPLGTGFVCITPGCFLLGSSIIFHFLRKKIAIGVDRRVRKKAVKKGRKIVLEKKLFTIKEQVR